MTPTMMLWFLAGMGAGGVHVRMLWLASRPPFSGAGWHWTRMFLVAAVLVTSAVYGAILPAAAGWGVAYFAAVSIIAMRSPG